MSFVIGGNISVFIEADNSRNKIDVLYYKCKLMHTIVLSV